MNKKLLNTQVESLTTEHGAEIVLFYKSEGFNTSHFKGLHNKQSNNSSRYYGVDAQGYFSHNSKDFDKKRKTYTLEELKQLINFNLTVDDFNIGDKCVILSEPTMWASICKSEDPLTKNLKYPYQITIRDKKYDELYTGIVCDNYGWDLSVLIENNLIQKTNKMSKFPFKLNKIDAEKIITAACSNWKVKLSRIWSDLLYKDSVEVTETFYLEMRKACTEVQNKLFDDIFGKETPPVDFSILNNTDVFFLRGSKFDYIFKGSDPFKSSIKGYSYSMKDRFVGNICEKSNVTELRLADEKEKELYYSYWPQYKVGDWVSWFGNNPIISQIAGKLSSDCWILDAKGYSNCNEMYLKLGTQEEIQSAQKPIAGQLYFVKNSVDSEWNLRYAADSNSFFINQKNEGGVTTWKYWRIAEGVKLPE